MFVFSDLFIDEPRVSSTMSWGFAMVDVGISLLPGGGCPRREARDSLMVVVDRRPT